MSLLGIWTFLFVILQSCLSLVFTLSCLSLSYWFAEALYIFWMQALHWWHTHTIQVFLHAVAHLSPNGVVWWWIEAPCFNIVQYVSLIFMATAFYMVFEKLLPALIQCFLLDAFLFCLSHGDLQSTWNWFLCVVWSRGSTFMAFPVWRSKLTRSKRWLQNHPFSTMCTCGTASGRSRSIGLFMEFVLTPTSFIIVRVDGFFPPSSASPPHPFTS